MRVKRCRNCHDVKPLSEYYLYKRTGDRYVNCKACHRSLCKSQRHQRQASLLSTPEGRMFLTTLLNAKRRGIEHSITIKDIPQPLPKLCPYTGLVIDYRPPNERRPRPANCPSLDRIDSSKGYIPENLQVISHIANTLKKSRSVAELVNFALIILRGEDIRGRFAKGVLRIHGQQARL